MKVWNGVRVSDETYKVLIGLDDRFENGEIDYNVWQYRTNEVLKEVGARD